MRQVSLSIFFFVLLSCGSNVGTDSTPDGVAATLDALLREAVDDSLGEVPGVSMTVLVPAVGMDWTGATGFADKFKKDSLRATQPFRIASLTKTFVAAAILRLHELDRLNIDDSIGPYLSESHRQLLSGAGYDLAAISLRHCLNHTSGLYDYAVSSPAYLEAVSQNARRRWSRTDQLQFAVDFGQPLWPPGGGYTYSDTGYVLLGEAIENAADTTLARGLRKLLGFAELGLTSTWLETLEPAPPNLPPPVRRYFGRQDFTDWDPSIDLWGGGGLVSTTRDLAVFFRALFTGKVFDRKETLALLLAANAVSEGSKQDYRQGTFAIQLYGETAYTHSGLWGSAYLYLPEEEATVVVNYTDHYRERLLKKTALLIHNLSSE